MYENIQINTVYPKAKPSILHNVFLYCYVFTVLSRSKSLVNTEIL